MCTEQDTSLSSFYDDLETHIRKLWEGWKIRLKSLWKCPVRYRLEMLEIWREKKIILPGQAKKKTIFAITGKFHYLLFKPALR